MLCSLVIIHLNLFACFSIFRWIMWFRIKYYKRVLVKISLPHRFIKLKVNAKLKCFKSFELLCVCVCGSHIIISSILKFIYFAFSGCPRWNIVRAVTFTKICKGLHVRPYTKWFHVPETVLKSFYKKDKKSEPASSRNLFYWCRTAVRQTVIFCRTDKYLQDWRHFCCQNIIFFTKIHRKFVGQTKSFCRTK